MKKLTATIIILCLLVPAALAGEHFFMIMLGGKLWDGTDMKMEVSPTEGTAPLTVIMKETSGVKEIIKWEWDFGDGNHTGTTQDTQHIYESAGEYLLTLTVFNEKEEKASDTVLIKVTEKKQGENTTINVVFDGATPISAGLSTKATYAEKESYLKQEINTTMAKESYPYSVVKNTAKTDVQIQKYKCKSDTCWYWISAYRGIQEVAIDNPVGISPPPIVALVSEVYDDKTDTLTITLREDPKLAVEQILQRHADSVPLGKAKVGTTE